MRDRYGNALSTSSAAARDAYVEGVDRMLAALGGVPDALERAVAEDPGFALAHIALARYHQVRGDRAAAQAPLDAARACAARARTNTDAREAAHIALFDLLLSGKAAEGYAAIRTHLLDYPRDALVAQTCTGVFGLIGFSGQPGREAEQLAFTAALAPHYGDDWWFGAQHAFSQMEAGQTGPAAATIDRALALHPRNANAAHIKAHLHYETGESAAGAAYLDDWMGDYDREGLLHCHLSWHVALWALERGDETRMWAVLDADLDPGRTVSPPLNVLTDTASLLYRAERRGAHVSPERWWRISDYAAARFPKPGLAFADVHAALAHAMAGRADALRGIVEGAVGPAADMVRDLGEAFGAIAGGRWAEAEAHLAVALRDHARIGGSRAQRDLLEFAMVSTLMRQGRGDEARRLLALRRPAATHGASVTA